MYYDSLLEVGYELNEQIFEGSRTVVWRATRVEDNTSVVLKFARQADADKRINKQLRSEFEILSHKLREVDHVIKSIDLVEVDQSWLALVEEDLGLRNLGEYIPITNIKTVLEISIILASTLSQIHQRKIFHKDIKPQNILVSSDLSIVKLTDFGSSSIFETVPSATG